MTLMELNQLSESQFVEACAPLLEHCEWVLPKLAAVRPFASLAVMQERLAQLIQAAPLEQQHEALCQHPKLGVGRAQPGFSQSEQKGAGLSQLTEPEMALFAELNERYESKMGFPFVVAVAGMTKETILEQMRSRSEATPEQEWPVALAELIKIAQLRVCKLVSDA
ncbi:2-oxo-4-hydroxy-4-carboxy-5-ureidoimidazoline decarboxylase [Hydrogenovibrio thermophilus]|uniref:2-oxo-4-hydroxy-4-carboxy-5-ureidoimidazoline decarboxylase n=1 Tax=Hydrogenovibrio thermophilus TaxID=265883 RepID=A0A410H4T8_9GAMM|nr:2-oxo-4-hydroxy-4-carboxy-5-ureidoimidazoline decarboxylase [Hydrogenovibrio thermophilus]QAB15943.1 2-oxo-4-hydroxy-4-carboxy-5-ureidoimidazoline decarboxylase [Hydrogenovibrio thermophilus]